MEAPIQYAFYSMPGLVRKNHEDNFFINGQNLEEINEGTKKIETGLISDGAGTLAGVFDGMGGEAAGETAAYLAARRMSREHETIRMWYHDPEKALEKAARPGCLTDQALPGTGKRPGKQETHWQESVLDQLCADMNETVCAYASENRVRSMGSTAAFILFGDKYISCANVGDSRIYRYRNGMIAQLSVDHIQKSFISRKGFLTQYLGIRPEEMVLQPYVTTDDFIAGTTYLLCTDGVTDMLKDEELQELLSDSRDLEQVIEKMRERILENGAVDNTTIMIMRI